MSYLAPVSDMTEASPSPVRVKPGLEGRPYVEKLLRTWAVLPTYLMVVEFYGNGDPFFGGNAEDLALGWDNAILNVGAPREDVAVFATIEEAHEAAQGIPNRRDGSKLGVLPVWVRKDTKYPRILRAIQDSYVLTVNEALACLDKREPEAIRFLGGADLVIGTAFRERHKGA